MTTVHAVIGMVGIIVKSLFLNLGGGIKGGGQFLSPVSRLSNSFFMLNLPIAWRLLIVWGL